MEQPLKLPSTAHAIRIALALALCASLVPLGTPVRAGAGAAVQAAYADELDELEEQVTQSAQAYNEAVELQEQLASEIEELDARIAQLEDELPAQRERSDESCVALYKYQADTASVVMMLLNASSITEMLSLLDQYSWIIESNIAEIETTVSMETELEDSKAALEADKASADQAADDALAALETAKAARQAAQEAAIAAQEAEEEAAQQAAEEAAEEAAQDEASAEEQEEAEAEAEATTTATSQASASTVDWSDDKTAFVEKWTSRIDSYLAGSPMAGCGATYAEAAWDYGVDPRWAPAISCIESTKGAYCFASYNAWGYGSSSFSSWDEGITTVVAALGSSTYGGYHTKAAAQTYCPSNADAWYTNVAAEMAKI